MIILYSKFSKILAKTVPKVLQSISNPYSANFILENSLSIQNSLSLHHWSIICKKQHRQILFYVFLSKNMMNQSSSPILLRNLPVHKYISIHVYIRHPSLPLLVQPIIFALESFMTREDEGEFPEQLCHIIPRQTYT